MLIACLATLNTQAQDNNTVILSFNHLALSVKDVNTSAKFYQTVLGLTEITNRTEKVGIRWFSMNDGKELHLISLVKDPVVINKAVHVAFTTANFDAFVARLNKIGITFYDWPGEVNKINIRADGIKQIFFHDPDGYWIEVNSVGS